MSSVSIVDLYNVLDADPRFKDVLLAEQDKFMAKPYGGDVVFMRSYFTKHARFNAAANNETHLAMIEKQLVVHMHAVACALLFVPAIMEEKRAIEADKKRRIEHADARKVAANARLAEKLQNQKNLAVIRDEEMKKRQFADIKIDYEGADKQDKAEDIKIGEDQANKEALQAMTSKAEANKAALQAMSSKAALAIQENARLQKLLDDLQKAMQPSMVQSPTVKPIVGWIPLPKVSTETVLPYHPPASQTRVSQPPASQDFDDLAMQLNKTNLVNFDDVMLDTYEDVCQDVA